MEQDLTLFILFGLSILCTLITILYHFKTTSLKKDKLTCEIAFNRLSAKQKKKGKLQFDKQIEKIRGREVTFEKIRNCLGFLAFVIWLTTYFVNDYVVKRERLKEPIIGKLDNRILYFPNNPSHRFQIYYGNNGVNVSSDALKKGFTIDSLFNFGITTFSMKLVNNQFLVTASIYDLDNILVATIEENIWNPINNKFRFNYDNDGFEVVDERNRPFLQIDFKIKESAIYLGGLFHKANQNILLSDKGLNIINNKEGIEELLSSSNSMFLYSGTNYIGKRNPKWKF